MGKEEPILLRGKCRRSKAYRTLKQQKGAKDEKSHIRYMYGTPIVAVW